jgi:hypothetical protein
LFFFVIILLFFNKKGVYMISSVSNFLYNNSYAVGAVAAATAVAFVVYQFVKRNFSAPKPAASVVGDDSAAKPVSFPDQSFLLKFKDPNQYKGVITKISEPNAERERTVDVEFTSIDGQDTVQLQYKIVKVYSLKDSFGDLSEDGIRDSFEKALIAKALPMSSSEITTRWLSEEINKNRKADLAVNKQLQERQTEQNYRVLVGPVRLTIEPLEQGPNLNQDAVQLNITPV